MTVPKRSPVTPSHVMSSNAHLRFSLRFVDCCISGPTRELGCADRELRSASTCLVNISLTGIMRRSRCREWFDTYHGACVISRNNLDWYLCMISMFDVEAHPQSSMPYRRKDHFVN
jgi:hypothetical protein